MAIHQEEIREVQGFEKEIEESALGMILDNLQKYQYQYPQRSTVRELVSNALDAVQEKYIALSILSGQSKPEDHFITRQEGLYKDSNWNPDYYNPDWLWSSQSWDIFADPSKVYVTYVDGNDREKDKIIIQDYGVGLGGRRLEGYFKIGFSTKRNAKKALGKFGIGAKSALATAPFYTMTTCYNGKEYSFQVYDHRIVPVIPRFDMETGEENPVETLSNGTEIYYRKVNKPNGTRVEIESKKHHKQLYVDAVKSQLLYFDNVEFRIQHSSGATDVIPIKAEILYEDEYIVLSNNNMFSKPHILLNKVNYGNIDFNELELEDMQGNIGIKVDPEQVTVNPSRESLIWDEITRETVVTRFRIVVDIAGRMISEQLKVEDFIEWIRACSQIASRWSGSNTVLGRLSRIVDISTAKIPYSVDRSLIFGPSLFAGIKVRRYSLTTEREGSIEKYVVQRDPVSIADFAEDIPIYVKREGTSFAREKYMLQELHPNGFIALDLPKLSESEDEDAYVPEDQELHITNMAYVRDEAKRLKMSVKDLVTQITKVSQYVDMSSAVIPYSSVIVPEDFDTSDLVQKQSKEEEQSKEMRKRLGGVIPIYTPRHNSSRSYNESKFQRFYEWQKLEIPVDTIDSWNEEEIFFATDKVTGRDERNKRDTLESDLLHLAALIAEPESRLSVPKDVCDAVGVGVSEYQARQCRSFFDKPRVKLVKVAQDRLKYFMDFKPIQRFFLDIKNKTLTMSNALIRWNTARIIDHHLDKLEFLKNFTLFHPKYAAWYQELSDYWEENYRDIERYSNTNAVGIGHGAVNALVQHCEKVTQLQLLVRKHQDEPELVAQIVKEMFNPEQEITNACAIDTKVYDKLMEMLDYAEPIRTLLNEVEVLKEEDKNISAELEQEIRAYMNFKQVPAA